MIVQHGRTLHGEFEGLPGRRRIVQEVASWKLMQRDAELTHYMWSFIDLVEGHQLQWTNNGDKSRTFASRVFSDW